MSSRCPPRPGPAWTRPQVPGPEAPPSGLLSTLGWCLCQVMGFVHSFIQGMCWDATSLKGWDKEATCHQLALSAFKSLLEIPPHGAGKGTSEAPVWSSPRKRPARLTSPQFKEARPRAPIRSPGAWLTAPHQPCLLGRGAQTRAKGPLRTVTATHPLSDTRGTLHWPWQGVLWPLGLSGLRARRSISEGGRGRSSVAMGTTTQLL